MRWHLIGLVAMAVVAASCGSGSPSPEPAESVPVLSGAPSGWVQVVGLGGTGGPWFTSGNITLGGRQAAIHASCVGTGTLIVLVTPSPVGNAAQPGASATFPCGNAGVETSVEIAAGQNPEVATISATVVEGLGTLRHASFSLSVEQPQP